MLNNIGKTLTQAAHAAEDLKVRLEGEAGKARNALGDGARATLGVAAIVARPVRDGYEGLQQCASVSAHALANVAERTLGGAEMPRRVGNVIVDEGHCPVMNARQALLHHIISGEHELKDMGLERKKLNRAYVKFHDGPAPRGVACFLHGYNAGTEQWAPHFAAAFELGYDVVALPLPGHGIVERATKKDFAKFTPQLSDFEAWASFVDDTVYRLAALGPITPVGLSAGGQLATQMATRFADARHADGTPVIEKLFAANPFFKLTGDYKVGPVALRVGAHRFTNQQAAEAFAFSPEVLHPAVDEAFGRIKIDLKKPGGLDYGARYGRQSQVIGLVRNGAGVLAEVHRLSALPGGVQFVGTWADDLVDTSSIVQAHDRAGASSRLKLYDRARHTITHPRENPDPAVLADFSALYRDFMASRPAPSR